MDLHKTFMWWVSSIRATLHTCTLYIRVQCRNVIKPSVFTYMYMLVTVSSQIVNVGSKNKSWSNGNSKEHFLNNGIAQFKQLKFTLWNFVSNDNPSLHRLRAG